LEEVIALPRRSPLAGELQRALMAASSLHGMRSDLEPVPVRATATVTEAGAYRFRKKDPIDVRVSRLGGRVALGFLHELGHLLDHQVFYDRKTRTWASATHIAFDSWRTVAAGLDRRPLPGGRGRQRYFRATHEVWARCYAQTVLLRSRDPLLERQLVKLQEDDDPHVWPVQQFEAVAVEVERVFGRLGLTQLTLPLAA
jgi:Fe-S cluster biosynthesis and repair protein YggX